MKYPGPRGASLKVVEKPGRPIMSGLRTPSSAPFCHDEMCPLQAAGLLCNDQCRVENVVYKAVCTRCRESQEDEGVHPDSVIDTVYIGETSRTLGVRSLQHRKDYRKSSMMNLTTNIGEETSSFKWDHQRMVHGADSPMDPQTDYGFTIIHRHRDALTRQLTEAVMIEEAINNKIIYDFEGNPKPVNSINRKQEYFQARRRHYYDDFPR